MVAPKRHFIARDCAWGHAVTTRNALREVSRELRGVVYGGVIVVGSLCFGTKCRIVQNNIARLHRPQSRSLHYQLVLVYSTIYIEHFLTLLTARRAVFTWDFAKLAVYRRMPWMATDAVHPMDPSISTDNQPWYTEQSCIKELDSLRCSMATRPLFNGDGDQLSVPSLTRKRTTTNSSTSSFDRTSPPRSSTQSEANYQYLILKNPPSDWNKPRKSGNSLSTSTQSLRKRRSVPDVPNMGLIREPPRRERDEHRLRRNSTPDLTSPYQTNGEIARERTITGEPSDYNDDDENYVLMRIPVEGQSPSIRQNSSRRPSAPTQGQSRRSTVYRKPVSPLPGSPAPVAPTVSAAPAVSPELVDFQRLSTPEARYLMESIRALKEPHIDSVERQVLSVSDKLSHWRTDSSGKYNYLLLKTPPDQYGLTPQRSPRGSFDRDTSSSSSSSNNSSPRVLSPRQSAKNQPTARQASLSNSRSLQPDRKSHWGLREEKTQVSSDRRQPSGRRKSTSEGGYWGVDGEFYPDDPINPPPPRRRSTQRRRTNTEDLAVAVHERYHHRPLDPRSRVFVALDRSAPLASEPLRTASPRRSRSHQDMGSVRRKQELFDKPHEVDPQELSYRFRRPSDPTRITRATTTLKSRSTASLPVDTSSQTQMRPVARHASLPVPTPSTSVPTSAQRPLRRFISKREVGSEEVGYGGVTMVRPTFWNPRMDEVEAGENVRKALGKRVKALLQPKRARIEAATKSQHAFEMVWSLERARTPKPGEEGWEGGRGEEGENPYEALSRSWDIMDTNSQGLEFSDDDFQQIDMYARNVKQQGPQVTPEVLVTRYLARPYKRDLHKIRAIFAWIIDNVGIGSPIGSPAPTNPEDDWVETAEEVLRRRWCRSGVGFARLFSEMAVAAGVEDVRVVYGFLRGPEDTVDTAVLPNGKIKMNHAWNAVKLDGTYRFIDCFLGSPYHPYNLSGSPSLNPESNPESNWFLTRPHDMIQTHLPTSSIAHQFLDPPLEPETWFRLPYVSAAFFHCELAVAEGNVWGGGKAVVMDDEVFHLTLTIPPGVACYAEVESCLSTIGGPVTTTKRALAQCVETGGKRVCRIKAVLPPESHDGWVKIYAGQRGEVEGLRTINFINHFNTPNPPNSSWFHTQPTAAQSDCRPPWPLALSLPISHAGLASPPFDFVRLHYPPASARTPEFYVVQPQCYALFPMQRYRFRVRGMQGDRVAKLTVRSPTGRIYKLKYEPSEWSYEAEVVVEEKGVWCLVCLGQGGVGGWSVVASWEV
ncbi:hypothetical protein BC937DRAFT_93396 [Endogone sp. FLAS-F59071]|nr:hypothetical protein BC937DRAFT_93396 [Endogone sp. FLAS-F59071]|eukprot:RUS21185.1 hypothetical protein BC937DRAFT_93396 [Endogone sp. FLAS-F59071]